MADRGFLTVPHLMQQVFVNADHLPERTWDALREGMGYKKIVTHLNASGATLRGRKWHISNLRDVLTRSTYRGRHLYGAHDTRNGIERPEEEWQ